MISQLSPRDRLALIVGAIVILATTLFLGVIEPYQQNVERLDSQIASRQQQLKEVQAMNEEYLLLQNQFAKAEKKLGRSDDFSLFSFVEGLTIREEIKENLLYMRPQPPSVRDDYREESMEIKLEKIRLDQLVRLLYAIESEDAFLQVKNMRIKTRFDDRSLLDTMLTISSFGKNI